MKEFEFDVRLAGTVRVKARSEKLAREAVEKVIAYCEPTQDFLDGFNEVGFPKITHFSLGSDFTCLGAEMVEVDGKPV